MEDYPRTLADFEKRFRSEEACRDYLFRVRWPEGFRCPRCGESRGWRLRSALWQCASCAYQASLTAGTIFQDTRTPLKVWFHALWWMTSQKNGVSALGLQRVLGLGSYQTAWCWLHKLRRAMVRPGRDRLSGIVEVDEAYVGAPEEEGRGIGRIRMRRIADASANRLMPFVEESIAPGSVVHTDGWLGYLPLDSKGYRRQITVLRGQRNPSELLPRVHRVISLLKRWLLGTHQGAVRLEHLDDYLNEFTFRFNRRRSRSRGKLFFRLVQQAVAVEPVPLDRILHPEARPKKKPQSVGAT